MTYLLEIIHHVLPEAFFDVLKTVPLLLIVYALLYYIENRLTNTPELLSRAAQFGPVVGALAGSIPQCGFSAAASALFSAGFLAPATLVAVFLATSDEAVPIMLAGGASVQQVVLLLVVKFAIAVIGGYVLRCTVFRKHKAGTDGPLEIEMATAAVRPRRWRTSCPTPSRPPSSCLSCCSRSTWSYTASVRSVSLPSC